MSNVAPQRQVIRISPLWMRDRATDHTAQWLRDLEQVGANDDR